MSNYLLTFIRTAFQSSVIEFFYLIVFLKIVVFFLREDVIKILHLKFVLTNKYPYDMIKP